MEKNTTDFEVLDFSELANIYAGREASGDTAGKGKFGFFCKCKADDDSSDDDSSKKSKKRKKKGAWV